MKTPFRCLGWQEEVCEVDAVVLAENKEEVESFLVEEFGSDFDKYIWDIEDASSESGILVVSYPNQGV
jgi:hypothetical protein